MTWFTGKTAAIIGGGGGIGREIALGLARDGVGVVVGDVDLTRAELVASEVEALGGRALAIAVDLASDASVAAFVDAAFGMFGRVDLLFNHAGVSVGGLLEDVTSDDWNWMLDRNVTGLGRSIAAFLPRMTGQEGGWIVNTSSGLGLFHDVPFAAPYIATKAAIVAYSRALATYVRNRGVGVSVFCPDITATDFVTSGRLKGIPPELAAGSLPLDRVQTAESAAATLLRGLEEKRFLISAVPNTHGKLVAMAEGDMEPGSETGPGAAAIVQLGRVRLPAGSREAAAKAFAEFAILSRGHHGCIAYAPAISLTEPDVICITEVWSDQAAVDAHAAAPETMRFVMLLLSLGASDLSVERVR